MTIVAFFLSFSETGAPSWLFGVAMLCDTVLIAIYLLTKAM